MHILNFVHGKNYEYLGTRMGNWYLVEVFGFVLLPLVLFFHSYRRRNLLLVKIAAVLTMLGVIINRLNVTIIGYNWDAPVQYYPTWKEIVVTLAIISIEIWVFRWVINRMPVLREAPTWAKD